MEAGCWLAVESHEEARMRKKRKEGTQGTPWSLRKTKEQKLVNKRNKIATRLKDKHEGALPNKTELTGRVVESGPGFYGGDDLCE